MSCILLFIIKTAIVKKEVALGLNAIKHLLPKQAIAKVEEQAIAKHEANEFSNVKSLAELVELLKKKGFSSEAADIELIFREFEDEEVFEYLTLTEFNKAIFEIFDYEDSELLCDAASTLYDRFSEEETLAEFIKAAKRIGFSGVLIQLYETNTFEIFNDMSIDGINDFLFWSKNEKNGCLDDILLDEYETDKVIYVSSANDALNKMMDYFEDDEVMKFYKKHSYLMDVKQVVKYFENANAITYYEESNKLIIKR